MAGGKSSNYGCAIKACDCKVNPETQGTQGANYQDTKYGYGLRVHNASAKGWRCTICGKERS